MVNEKKDSRSVVLAVTTILLGVHVAVDAAIVGWIRRPADEGWLLLAAAAVPLAQATLVAAWAALSPIRSYVRIPLAILAFAWLWHVQCRSLDFECRDYLSADHALSLATQGTLVLLVLLAARTVAWSWRRRRNSRDETPVQFSIGSLLCWTAAVALLLGLGKFALVKSGWTSEFVHGRMFFVGAVVGAYDAAVGLLALAIFIGRKQWLFKTVAALFIVALLVLSEKPVLKYLFEFDWAVNTAQWYALTGLHLAYLAATLLPLALCGVFSMRKEGTGSVGPQHP
jgi:hypothetical protein